jgi:hypothetical protein
MIHADHTFRPQIEDTQKAIREALEERYDAWQEARDVLTAGKDPDIEINDEGRLQWRPQAEPYDTDEIDGQVVPMTRPGQGEVPQHSTS